MEAKASVTSPPSPLASTVASSCPRKHTRPSAPKRTTSPGFSRFAGRTNACQREPSSRLISVAAIAGSRCLAAADPAAVKLAGMTLVSLTTSASPRAAAPADRASCVLELGRLAGRTTREPRRIARARRPQRDPVLRQGEIELVGAHGSSISLVKLPAGWRFAYKGHIATFDAAINVTASAVIQVKPGIGDVIWHLPFVRAIAAISPGRQVTFLAPWTSGAKELLAAEPSVAETVYFASCRLGAPPRAQSVSGPSRGCGNAVSAK